MEENGTAVPTLNLNEIAETIGRMEPVVNRIVSRASGVDRTSHGGHRNYDAQLGYKRRPDSSDIMARAFRSPELVRVIQVVSERAWRTPPPVTDEDGKDSPWSAAWTELAHALDLWGAMECADELSQLLDYGALVIGFNDSPESNPLASSPLSAPVGTVSGDRPVLYVTPYGADALAVQKTDDDPASERFGRPLLYTLDMGGTASSVAVHWTRVIHVPYRPLSSPIYGRPVSLAVWDLLDDVLKGIAGPIEGTWRSAVAMKFFLKMPNPADGRVAAVTSEQREMMQDLAQRLDRMVHNLTSAFVGMGLDDIQTLQGDPIDPSANAEVIWKRLAMARGIPYRILVGNEAGDLASSQDTMEFAAVVASHQKKHCERRILRPLIKRLVQYGALPEPSGDLIIGDIDPMTGRAAWPNPVQLSALSEAEVVERRYRAAATAAEAREHGALIDDNEIRAAAGLPPVELMVSNTLRTHAHEVSPVGDIVRGDVGNAARALVAGRIAEQLEAFGPAGLARLAARLDQEELGAVVMRDLPTIDMSAAELAAVVAPVIDEARRFALAQIPRPIDVETEARGRLNAQEWLQRRASAIVGSAHDGPVIPGDYYLDPSLEQGERAPIDEATARATARSIGAVAGLDVDEGRLIDAIAGYRAAQVVDTLIAQTHGRTHYAYVRETGPVSKTWLETLARRPDPVHLAQVGETVPFNESFTDGSFWSNERFGCQCGVRVNYE